MGDLFELAMPWWEFVLRAVVVYVAVLVMVRLSGKRTVGQFTPFDLIVVVLLGTAVQNSLIGKDTSLLGGLLLAATLIGLNWLVGMVTSRFHRIEKIVEGEPVVLARNGQVFEHVLRRQLISKEDFELALRMSSVGDISDVDIALLETNGHISVVQKKRT